MKKNLLTNTKKNLAKAKTIANTTNTGNFDKNYKKLKKWSMKFYFFWMLFDRIDTKKLGFLANSFFTTNKEKMDIPQVMLDLIEHKRKNMMLRCRLY